MEKNSFQAIQAVLALPEAEQTDVLTLDDWHQESQLSVTALNFFPMKMQRKKRFNRCNSLLMVAKRLELLGRVVLVSQR